MSIHVISNAWKIKAGSASKKLVLLCLSDHAEANGQNSFPGIKKIAAETELSEATVIRALKSLESDGIIAKTSPSTRAKTSVFSVNMECHGDTSSRTASGVTMEPIECHGDTPPVLYNRPLTEQSKISQLGRNGQKNEFISSRPLKFIPDDWELPQDIRAMAKSLGLPDHEIDLEIDNLRDHQFRDGHTHWDRVARKWLRTASEEFKWRHQKLSRLSIQQVTPASQRPLTFEEKYRHQLDWLYGMTPEQKQKRFGGEQLWQAEIQLYEEKLEKEQKMHERMNGASSVAYSNSH